MMFHPGFSPTYAVVVEAVHLNVVWTERAVVEDRVWHRVGDVLPTIDVAPHERGLKPDDRDDVELEC